MRSIPDLEATAPESAQRRGSDHRTAIGRTRIARRAITLIAALLLTCAATGLVGVSGADAQMSSPSATFDPAAARAGDSIRIDGAGFAPNEVVDIAYGGPLLATAFADSNGDFVTSGTIEASMPTGAHPMDFHGDLGSTLTVDFTVLPPVPAAPPVSSTTPTPPPAAPPVTTPPPAATPSAPQSPVVVNPAPVVPPTVVVVPAPESSPAPVAAASTPAATATEQSADPAGAAVEDDADDRETDAGDAEKSSDRNGSTPAGSSDDPMLSEADVAIAPVDGETGLAGWVLPLAGAALLSVVVGCGLAIWVARRGRDAAPVR